MTVPELNEAGIGELSQLADARYYDWHARELRPEQDRQIAELDSQKVSEGGRALLALRVRRDFLTRAAQERISIYEAVGREKTCWAMFSKRRLDDLRQRIMHSVGAEIGSLKSRSQRAANAVGQPVPLHEKRYEDMRTEVLTTVNISLAKLEAEGRVAILFRAPPPSSAEEQQNGSNPIGDTSVGLARAEADSGAKRAIPDSSLRGIHPPLTTAAMNPDISKTGSDGAVWSSIRADLEGLAATEWSLIWSSRPPVWLAAPVQLPSQWTWFKPTDWGLRARASAIFLKAAKARGYDSEDQWLDELRYAEFVTFQLSASSRDKLADGTFIESESGILKDAVAHSITLCHQLEAGCAPKPVVGTLAKAAMARIEQAGGAFLVDVLKKLERDGIGDSPRAAAELLCDFVIHQFTVVARECMAVCASDEFGPLLRTSIARFVKVEVAQHRWLSDSMRQELNVGFTFFVMGANPWAGIPATERASRWLIGGITGEALSRAAEELLIEAAAEMVGKQEVSESATVRAIAGAGPAFPNRALWLKAKLAERDWSKHDLQRQGGPEHRTTQKILNGYGVQEDILRKVIGGLSAKPNHKRRNLPLIAESEIPKD